MIDFDGARRHCHRSGAQGSFRVCTSGNFRPTAHKRVEELNCNQRNREEDINQICLPGREVKHNNAEMVA